MTEIRNIIVLKTLKTLFKQVGQTDVETFATSCSLFL
jgi:hypothetical protein